MIHKTDLSNFTISFGYSFKKVNLNFRIRSIPSTASIWLRTNYTKNKRIVNYYSKCFTAYILTNEKSNLILGIGTSGTSNSTSSINQNQTRSVDQYFDLAKTLVRNRWTQLVFVQTEYDFRLFVDGAVHFDFKDFDIDYVEFNCVSGDVADAPPQRMSSKKPLNYFEITDYDNETRRQLYEPMRGEITRVNVFNFDQTDEDILNGFFKCVDVEVNGKANFIWSHVLIDEYLSEFNRKPSSFCSSKFNLKSFND